MARKMHHSFQQISSDSPKVSEAGSDSLSRKNQEQHIVTSLENCGESSLLHRNSDSRCAILAFVTLESDGHWRIGAMPVWCVNHIRLATGVNMDALQLGFPPSLSRLMIDQQKGQRTLPACAYSAKSFQGRSITGSNAHRHCQNKIANKAFKLNELTENGCSQSSLICTNSSGLLPDSSTAVNTSCMAINNTQEGKSLKKSSRKKARKKGRQSKKHSCDSGSTKAEVCPEEDVCVSLASEICSSNDVDNLDKILFPDDRLINNDSERSEMDDSINLTEEVKTCISYIDEAEMSKAMTPTVQKFSGESAICTSKNQLQNRGSESALIQDSLVLDSVSVGSNSDESTNVADVKQSNNSRCRISHPEPPGIRSEDGYILSQNLLKEAGSTIDHDEGIRHGASNYSSNDKRVRQKRSVPRSSSVKKTGGVGNLHGRTGKENSHSVWQKVQKNDSDECHRDLKKVNSSFLQSDTTSKRAPSVNKICNLVVDTILSKTEDKKHLKNKVSRNSGGKIDPTSKGEYCSFSRKGSHLNRSISNDSSKISFQQDEMPNISFQENNVQGLCNVSGSHSHTNSTMFGFQTDNRVEQITSGSVDNVQVNLEGSDPRKDGWHVISTMSTQNMKKLDSSLPMACDHTNQLKLSEEQYPMNSHLLGNEIGQIEKEVSSTDYNERKRTSGSSTVWRWIPIGKKDVGPAISESDSSTLANSDGLSSKDSSFESNVEAKAHSFFQNHISSSNAGGTCMVEIFSNFPCRGEDENLKIGSQFSYTLTQHRNKEAVPDHLVYECENLSVLETDSYKIAQSVNDVCRAQLACEAVQMATGSPIAEFERLLHCCSPVICRSINSFSCLTCLHDHGIPLCRHEIPNLSLECLWQWYEKHGSYGLEIRAEERVGVGHSPFRAYFVPSLSAVQLFKNCKSQFLHCGSKFPNCKASEENEISDMSENSSIANPHPICFPQAHSQDASIPVPANQMLCSEADNASDPYMDSTGCGDLELLFEYFESEQPQQRQPLYEKIQELIGGHVPAHSKIYGDPTKLNSINLQDLHPRSWYSVAWYPIYRIPEGNFRASFLTYHSLGHLVPRSVKTEPATVNSCVVAPAVGLQSYNAQSECWFQLRHSAQRQEEIFGLNPSSLLKEHLQTLEETASLMARAVVNKGNLISKNRHPDFEFFLSRRRY